MSRVLAIGDCQVDPGLRVITRGAQQVRIEPKAMQVLVQLAEHAGEVVSREHLLRTVWADTFVGDEVLSKAISELRRVFDDDSRTPRFIQTIPKGGYRLIASVHRDSETATATPVPSATTRGQFVVGHLRRVTLIAVAAFVVVTVASGGWFVVRGRGVGESSAPMTIVPLTALPGREGPPSFSPDGSRIVFDWTPPSGSDSRILAKTIGDDEPRELTRGAQDSFPAWSPDGRSIAYLHGAGYAPGLAESLYVMSALGGSPRMVYSGPMCAAPAWTPDGRTLIFPIVGERGRGCRLNTLSLDSMEASPLVFPDEPAFWDWFPALSPDGRTVAFVRQGPGPDLYVVSITGGRSTRLTDDEKPISGPIAWTPDGQSILFSSTRAGSSELWRISVHGGEPTRMSVAGDARGGVVMDPTGTRLAYVAGGGFMRIRAFDLTRPEAAPAPVAESSRNDHNAVFSPDGSHLAFCSDRAGSNDIWTADANGDNPVRLTNTDHAYSGSPGWSPDGRWVAFDSLVEGAFQVYVVRAAGGAPKRLTSEPGDNSGPGWSSDGKWIYFGSTRTGRTEVWKVPAGGGEASQVTRNGGFGGVESADGMFLYYTKSNDQPGIWRVPVAGGREEPIVEALPAGLYSRYWTLVGSHLYYLNDSDSLRPSVEAIDVSTRRSRTVLRLPGPACVDASSGLAISPDGRRLLTCMDTPGEADILMVNNFR